MVFLFYSKKQMIQTKGSSSIPYYIPFLTGNLYIKFSMILRMVWMRKIF